MSPPSARLLLFGTLLSGGAAFLATGCAPEPRAPRHVVLISLDTLRADHLGCYGSDVRTPNVDALAAEGIVFRDVTTAAPTTLASHVSLMTGTSPRTHGVPRNGFEIDSSNELLAERLKRAGFGTAAFLGSFALDHHFGFHRGFDVFDREFDLLLTGTTYDQNQRRARDVTDAVLAHLDRAPEGRHFLFVHYFDAHSPYDPPPPYDRMYGRPGGPVSADLADVEERIAAHHRAAGHPVRRSRALFLRGLTPELAGAVGEPSAADDDMAALYAGEVSYLDHHLGRLFDGLRERGLLEDALVILTADHGESFWEHGDFWNHGLWVYDTTVRVPLVLRLPGGARGGLVVAEPASTLDVVPTVLDLLGLPVPDVEGRSLVPALRGEPVEDRAIFSEATQPAGEIEEGRAWRNQEKPKAVRSGRWKYVRAPYLGVEQLFDLERDPGERNDLLAGDPPPQILATRDRLRERLDAWSADPSPLPSRFSADANAEVVERLRSLGYLGGPDGDEPEEPEEAARDAASAEGR